VPLQVAHGGIDLGETDTQQSHGPISVRGGPRPCKPRVRLRRAASAAVSRGRFDGPDGSSSRRRRALPLEAGRPFADHPRRAAPARAPTRGIRREEREPLFHERRPRSGVLPKRSAHMNRAMNLVVLAVAGGILLAGCAAKEARWSRDSASLVVYAAKSIPLYP